MPVSYIAKILRRSLGRTVLFILLLTLVGTFLCLGGGIFATAQQGISSAEEDFTTIITPSLPAMREQAGMRGGFNLFNEADTLSGTYRDWVEHQGAWNRFTALYNDVVKAGNAIPGVTQDGRRLAMAYVQGVHSLRPEDSDPMSIYYNAPFDRVAYVVECVGTAELDMQINYVTNVQPGIFYGASINAQQVKNTFYRAYYRWFWPDQPGVSEEYVQFPVANFRVEEILSLQHQVIREPEWLKAAVPIYPLDSAGETPEAIFEPGKRYIVLGRYISETVSGSYGLIMQKDVMAYMPNQTAITGNGLVDKQGGVELLPKDWIYDQSNPVATSSAFMIADVDFEYDFVRTEITGTLEEFLNDPANIYWKEQIEAIKITNDSARVLTTDDTQSIFAFNQNRLSITVGRDITSQEYDSGANVCLVSREYARLCKIRLGDTLPMQFYPGRYSVRPYTKDFLINPTFMTRSMPYDSSLGLTPVQEFTVVGMYSGDLAWDKSDYSISANTVILPDKAMPQLADTLPPDGGSEMTSPLLLGLTIPNDQAQAVYDTLGEMEYGRLFAITDQGYSTVVPGLTTIRNNSIWLLAVCMIAWIAVLVLFLLLFVFRQSKEVGIMLSLGAKRKSVVRYLLMSVLTVTLLSALLSAGAAYFLYDAAFEVALQAPSTEAERIGKYSEVPVTRNSAEERVDLLRAAFVPENKETVVIGIVGGQWALIAIVSWICSSRLAGGNPMLMIKSKEG